MPSQGPGPNQGVLGKGQGPGQALLEETAKPAATPQGTLLPGTGRSVASLAWPWVPPGGGGGVALRPLCAKPESLDEEVSSLWGRAQLARDWWPQQPTAGRAAVQSQMGHEDLGKPSVEGRGRHRQAEWISLGTKVSLEHSDLPDHQLTSARRDGRWAVPPRPL